MIRTVLRALAGIYLALVALVTIVIPILIVLADPLFILWWALWMVSVFGAFRILFTPPTTTNSAATPPPSIASPREHSSPR